MITLPGLVNTHDHLRSLLPMTRRADTAGLAEMIKAGQEAGAAATAADYRALTALAAARMALSGVTTVVDHVYPLHDPDMLAAVAAGHADVGIRARLAYGIVRTEDVARAEAAAQDIKNIYLAPVSIRQTGVEGYRAAVQAADRTGLCLYTHVAETADEVRNCAAEHGKRPVELLHDLGFLRPGTVLVHCVYLSEREIELLAETGTAVAYCPTNHLKLAKGFAPITKLRAAGVRVGLGIDGMTDLFTEMRQAVYAQGQAAGRPGALTSEEAFLMATEEGAAAVQADTRADMVTLRPSVAMRPLVDPLQAVVHRAHGTQVVDVRIDGEFVVRGGRLARADEEELGERAWQVTRDLATRTGRRFP
ncbi:amidohydrolase family protein [Nonomuraea sp. NPDC050536]|uniref:amidohydrolase family protein n=1 Tax=Nonomuraea sp. NPDC050536 TaxID=3364366 RepID=UPI0037C85B61